MKVLEVPFHYYPDTVGGTEVYVSSLARELVAMGVAVEIAAPGDVSRSYLHEGIPVHRVTVKPHLMNVFELYGDGDPAAAEQFARIADRVQPDLVHLHALSPAVSLLVAREMKKRGVPLVFTYHIPGITCPRGTLLRYDREVCDGVWGLHKCSSCVLQSHGLAKPLSKIVGSLPPAAGRALEPFQGRAFTALRMTALQASRQRALTGFLAEADHIVAVSEWVRNLLLRNGIADDKVTVCRHGRTQEDQACPRPAPEPARPGPLRVAFIGRLYPAKGLHVLVRALLEQPALPVSLDIYGIVQDHVSVRYQADLEKRAAADSRIAFLPPIPQSDVLARLAQYDVLAVPSQWMETGPLVVYDAFAAGIPVIGSNRGGIAELVEHGQNGLLVEPSDSAAWAAALGQLALDRALLKRLRAGIQPPRTMAAVAREMLDVYEQTIFLRRALRGAAEVFSPAIPTPERKAEQVGA